MTGADVRKSLSQNIKHFREVRRLSQADLAYKANISIPFLSDIERGNKWPHPDPLASLATALQVETFELFVSEGIVGKEAGTLVQKVVQELVQLQKQVADEILLRYIGMGGESIATQHTTSAQ